MILLTEGEIRAVGNRYVLERTLLGKILHKYAYLNIGVVEFLGGAGDERGARAATAGS